MNDNALFAEICFSKHCRDLSEKKVILDFKVKQAIKEGVSRIVNYKINLNIFQRGSEGYSW
jgi:hypothetical protein